MTMYNDFLHAKTRQLGRLRRKSGRALDMVNRTIDELQNANERIADTMAEIEDYREMLAAKQTELDGVMQKNSHIVSNFKALIDG